MKLPRLSIANLMAVVALIAIDISLIKSQDWYSLILLAGFLPLANILAISGLAAIRGALWRNEVTPFLFGFQVSGWTALFVYTIISNYPSFVATSLMDLQLRLEDLICDNLVSLRLISRMGLSDHDKAIYLASLGFVYLVPQLLIALAGGWISSRLGIKVVIERKRTRGSESSTT